MNSDTSITAYSLGEDVPDDVYIRVTSIGGTSAVTAATQLTYVA